MLAHKRLLAALLLLAILALHVTAQSNGNRPPRHGRRRPHGPSFPVRPATPYVRVIPPFQQYLKPPAYQQAPPSPSFFPQPQYKPVDDTVRYPEEPYQYQSLVNQDYSCPKVYQDEAKCRPLKDCAVWFDLISHTYGSPCKLHDGSPGTCCPDIPYNGHDGAFRTNRGKDVKILYKEIDAEALNWGSQAGLSVARVMGEREVSMISNNITVRPTSSVFKHMRFFQKSQATVDVGRGAYTVIEATRALAKRFELSPDEAGFGLNAFSIRGTVLSATCPAQPACDEKTINSPYRTFDGTCNNVRYTAWGSARHTIQRILPPNYSDGVWQPRVSSKSGQPLPR